jgi:hypothetical protein
MEGIMKTLTLFAIILSLSWTIHAGSNLGNAGTFAKWSKVEINMTGPSSNGNAGGSPNPFKIQVDVTFSDGSNTYVVPAFFNGTDAGSQTGTVWKVRFSPNKTGSWSFSSSSANSTLNGYTGTFTVNDPPSSAPDFLKHGWLKESNTHYLKFADGPYWIKGGADDPEDFLSTTNNSMSGYCSPCWPNSWLTWSGKKSAIDYLSTKGVNSLYIMTHTLGGDNPVVSPWVSSSAKEYFDNSKLANWEDLFSHMQNKGVVLHLVLQKNTGNSTVLPRSNSLHRQSGT